LETLFQGKEAFGYPGIAPKWTRSEKEGVGTAYNTSSRIWFTLSHGIVNEVYFPALDSPQIRDMEFLITDGETFFHEEKRDLTTQLEYLDRDSLGYRITKIDPQGRYQIVKEIIADPHLPSLLIHTRLEGTEDFLKNLHLFVLLAPHLGKGGWGNNAAKFNAAGQSILVGFRIPHYLALGTTLSFKRSSCGFVGTSDGWTDLHDNFQMDWEFDYARDGNVAVMGEIDLSRGREFTVGLSFGFGLHDVTTTLLQSLGIPFSEQKKRFQEQWQRICCDILPLGKVSGDGGRLYNISHSLLLAHEDKTFPGAMIASMSIPWGEIHGDAEGLGGYHLVWTRDLCKSATSLLAAGNKDTPFRALVYLATSQLPDGGFYQNFWINGEPYWQGVQLDEVAFPVILAWRLNELKALKNFDPYPMVLQAARYLICHGPATPQDRWEESSGYSPSTLASNISALICAADFARERKDDLTARFLEEYSDFLESHIEAWTVTDRGTLVQGVTRHYIRIHPVEMDNPEPNENPNEGILFIPNHAAGRRSHYLSKEIVDAGFLELVRYGLRKAGDSLIEDSLNVIDTVLKVNTPVGPCWRRYNHDGYGQRPDGGPFNGWGTGRAWPLLTGERGHYELAVGRDVRAFIKTIEGFSSSGGMLPEQIWDAQDLPQVGMFLGRPTGSAMPLMWSHAEYIKLLRSVYDGAVFEMIAPVADRYLSGKGRKDLEIWKLNRRVRLIAPGHTLRIQASFPFKLHYTQNDWVTKEDVIANSTMVNVFFVDIPVPRKQRKPIRFTFYRTEEARWEGKDFIVGIQED